MHNDVEVRATDWVTCKDGPWYPSLPHGGYVSYRIYKGFDGLRWFQRHEWLRADGTTEMEDWIPSSGGWPGHMVAAEHAREAV